jgi:hypothetical protein
VTHPTVIVGAVCEIVNPGRDDRSQRPPALLHRPHQPRFGPVAGHGAVHQAEKESPAWISFWIARRSTGVSWMWVWARCAVEILAVEGVGDLLSF